MTRYRDWKTDSLSADYSALTISLGLDPDGEIRTDSVAAEQQQVVSTLVRYNGALTGPSKGAVLYVHGFTDYFFQKELAQFFAHQGYQFYALDLRKCGRSTRPGFTPHFMTSTALYDAELDSAHDIISDETAGAPFVLASHSTGGLICGLWADRLRQAPKPNLSPLQGLIFSSPWLELMGPPLLRSPITTTIIHAIAQFRPLLKIPTALSLAYGKSLHHSEHGEWDYNLTWKPIGGFPVTFGFMSAIRRGQRKLQKGLNVGAPSLVLCSDKTLVAHDYSPQVDRADIIIDAHQTARFSGCFGNRVTCVPITDARHDVFLSLPEVRAHAYTEVELFLQALNS